MKKYLKILTTGLQNDTVYRVNFVMWRIRQIIIFLVPFFIWTNVLSSGENLYGYNLDQLLTYVFGTVLLRSLIFGSRTIDLANIINNGDLTLYLLKPINIFKYWFTRDISDKLINLSFVLIEFPLLILIFNPPIFIQTNPLVLLKTALAILVAIVMYFYLNFLFGTIGFWSREVWAPRFLLFVILEFAVGGIFPLDMLPEQVQKFLNFTPFPYMLFFPLKTYLGESPEYWTKLMVAIIWMLIFRFAAQKIYQLGLKNYEAEGR